MAMQTIDIDLNRVEGDLEFQLDVEEGVVVDARCIGVMYRGFEQILIGRTPRDAVVITPRVCGICGTAHMYSGVLALEQIWQVPVPPNATRIRNLCLMAETIQSDLRQTFLMFTVDFCNPSYQKKAFFDEALTVFEPFKGKCHLEALEYSKKILEVVAIFGGQWPHSSYMLPGGVVTEPTTRRIIECTDLVDQLIRWYERSIIGCSLSHFLSLTTADDFFSWLEEKPEHSQSAIGYLTRISRELGLHEIGLGAPNMISYGAYCIPEQWLPPYTAPQHLVESGFYNAATQSIETLDHQKINEHVRHSWYYPYEGGLHPWQGETIPDYIPSSDRYTWTKAPRYEEKVTQTGPMAELLIGRNPLTTSLYSKENGNTWLRQFTRIYRVGENLLRMHKTLMDLAKYTNDPHYEHPPENSEVDGAGFGLIQAARGSLGHWIKIKNGVIEKYQIVTPTAWNASPKDSIGQRGHWEESVIGLPLQDPDNPLEIGHVVRSHDPCLVCTVHLLPTGKRITYGL